MERPFTFAQRLQMLIDDRGITKSELARVCEIDKANITRYLKGEYEAKADVVYRIAKNYGVSESWLMGYDVPSLEDPLIVKEPYEKWAEADLRLIKWFRSLPIEKQRAILTAQDAPEDLV